MADRRRVRHALRLTAVAVFAGLGLLGTAAHPIATLSHIAPVAFVAPIDSSGLDDGPATGQEPPAVWTDPPAPTAPTQPMPSLVGVEDPPNPGPPPAVSPEVARLLALLRLDAKGSPGDVRPGVQALAAGSPGGPTSRPV